MSDQGASVLLYALMLLLPLSALLARRPPLGQTIRFALAWIAIFGIGLVIGQYRDELPDMRRLFNDQQIVGEETRVRMNPDGHFYAEVTVNGVERRMLIDSGATLTALSMATAQAAGIDTEGGMFPVLLETANGTVEARRATAEVVQLGSIRTTGLGVVTSPAFGDTDVIGMNFLSRLAGWRVNGQVLILTPPK